VDSAEKSAVLPKAKWRKPGLLHLLLYKSLLIVSNVFPQGSLMPREATLALRQKTKGFI
jgi:hypothetical protein